MTQVFASFGFVAVTVLIFTLDGARLGELAVRVATVKTRSRSLDRAA